MYNVTYPKREDPAFRVSVRVFTVEHRRFIDRVVLATQQFYLFESYLSEWNRGWRIVDRILVYRSLSNARENTVLVDRSKVRKQKRTVEAT